jgi:hypothetical protein
MITTVLTGPFIAFAAAMWDPSGDQDGRLKYVVEGELWKGWEIVFSRAKSVVLHIFTVRSSLYSGLNKVKYGGYLGGKVF